jgi:hypothetical protein
MTRVCYECHTERTEAVKVAEDASQEGYTMVRAGNVDAGVQCYRRAAEILREIPDVCKQHVPPLFCVGVPEARLTDFDGSWVWLPSIMGPHVLICERCGLRRPCVDCDSVKASVLRRFGEI